MKEQSGVYLVTCLANGRKYVGSSKEIAQRWREHRGDLSRNRHHNDQWQKAWNKYGADQFEWRVLEETERNDEVIRAREQHWIDILHPEFNVSVYAFPSRLGATNGKLHRRRISAGQSRRWARLSEDERIAALKPIQASRESWWAGLSKEERSKIQRHGKPPVPVHIPKYHRPRRLTPEERERRRREWEAGRDQRKAEANRKRSEMQKGKPKSEEQKAKLRAAALAKWSDPAYRARHRKATRAAMKDPDVLKRLSESHKGKPLKEEQKRKIGEAHRGMKRPPETGRKISEAQKRRWARVRAKKE